MKAPSVATRGASRREVKTLQDTAPVLLPNDRVLRSFLCAESNQSRQYCVGTRAAHRRL